MARLCVGLCVGQTFLSVPLNLRTFLVVATSFLFASSMAPQTTTKIVRKQPKDLSAKVKPVRLVTLAPGHFHAALVQKVVYPDVSPVVSVYAAAGPELDEHLKRVEGYNARSVSPTNWEEKVYTGDDFFERMLRDKPGNVVVVAGNNREKTDYISRSLAARFNVLADKPMCIDAAGFEKLKAAFKLAARKRLLLYDIMTERYEITTILQRALVNNP